VLTTAVAVTALGATLARRRRLALGAAAGWAGLTAQFAAQRVRSGPRTGDEVTTMALSSVAIPPVATLWWLRGRWQHRRAARVALPPPWRAGRAAW
jgi:hypothetical protein